MARRALSVVFPIGCVVLAAGTAPVLTFTRADHASDAGARAVVSADFNRDGWLDVAHANIERNSVTVLLSRGGAGFARAFEIPVGAGPFDLTTADFNRDGIPDLAVANADGSTISILTGRGDGSFTRADIAAPSQNPRGITAADVNHDGRADLIYTGFATGTVQVLLGNGSGGFTKGSTVTVPGSQPQGIAAGDFDHDGFLDLAVACNSAGGLRILSGTSGGAFTVRTIAGHAGLNVLAVGDLNGDGWADVAAASTGGGDVAVYLGGATGPAFAHASIVGASPRGLALGDVNDDGRLDVITANRSSSTVSVLAGDPAHPGSLLAHQEFAAARGSRAVVAGDFDGDGRLDVVTGNEYTAAVSVLASVTPFERAAFTFSAITLPTDALLGGGGEFRRGRIPGFATADFNRDGKIDFVIAGGASPDAGNVVVVLRDGPSVILGGPTPLTGFLVGDFNGDGNADVLYYSADPATHGPIVTNFVSYVGDGHGHFSASATTVEPQLIDACAAGDMNRDGRLDLVCDNRVMLGNGNGTFAPGLAFTLALPDGASVFRPQIADVNRDGNPDVVYANAIVFGDGTGGLTLAESLDTFDFGGGGVGTVADLNHDGYLDLVIGNYFDTLTVAFGSADGFQRIDHYGTNEGYASLAVADLNMDGRPDIVVNASDDPENAGVMIMFGRADGTFDRQFFAVPPGPVVVADLTGDGLPDVATYDAHAVHVLVNERNDVNHPPVVPDYGVTSGNPCVALDAKASDPDQQLIGVEWFDPSGAEIANLSGSFTALNVCVDRPGTYKYRRTASDFVGGTASGTVSFTYVQTLKEIVLYAAADNVTMTGHWSRVADPAAAGGFRAHDLNVGAPKVTQPSATPVNTVTIPFLADPNLTYKLWVRLEAHANSWTNDSVWMQFSNAFTGPLFQDFVYTPGTPSALSVSLEECVNCGVSEWGWEDDGFGAVNRNGGLLRFASGPQVIVIQTREDGVSIDQVVLSAEKYLTTRPGTAKNDHTILPATPR